METLLCHGGRAPLAPLLLSEDRHVRTPPPGPEHRDDAKRIAIECDNPLSKTMASFAVFHPVCVPLGNFMGRNFKR